MLAESDAGRWAARTTGRSAPRQNGKGDEIEVVEAWGLIQRGEWIVHTAHEIPTAKAAHRRLVGFLEGHPDLRRLIRQVRYANGDQSIEMTSGAIIVYRTRTAGGGRGLDDISRIVVDEAQYAQSEQLASAMPILSANPNPQVNFTGSAGIADRSDWWWTIRLRALADDPGEFSYLEHSAEEVSLSRDGHVLTSSPDIDDVDAWFRANAALGVRIEEDFLTEERRTLGPKLFAREHLGIWDPYPGEEGGFLPSEAWIDLAIEPPSELRSVAFGLSVSVDGSSAAFASAGRLPNGDLYVDTVDERPGTGWIVDRAVDLCSRRHVSIRVNPAAPEGAFIRPLTDAGVKIEEIVSRKYRNACGEIFDAINNGTIHHLGQVSLNQAVRAVRRRDVGKAGGWEWADPVSGADVSTLRAATLALTGVTVKRAPRIHVLEGAT